MSGRQRPHKSPDIPQRLIKHESQQVNIIQTVVRLAVVSILLQSPDSSMCVAQRPLQTDRKIDLLAMIKPADHAVQGVWKHIDGSLSVEQFADARIMIPVVVDGDYVISMQFTRLKGQGCVALVVPVADTQILVQVDSAGGKYAGLSQVNNKHVSKLVGTPAAIRQPNALPNGERHHLSVSVSKRRAAYRIEATVDGRKIANWNGRAQELSFSGYWTMPNPGCFGVFVHKSIADIHNVKLVMGKKSEGYQLADDWKNPLTVIHDAPNAQVARQCLDWNGKKYLISAKPMHLADAQRFAGSVNGRLVTISTSAEQEFLFERGRGVGLWTSGWRPPSRSQRWRDDRNRPWRYSGRWLRGQPNAAQATQWNIGMATGTGSHWNDLPASKFLHACVEWGEEYPVTE